MLLDYSPKNPFREVHWRWGRAGYLLDAGLPLSRRRDDRWVRAAHRFRQALAPCTTPTDFYALAEQHQALYWAHQFWTRREDPQHRMHTHALEARLLADQDYAAVAGKLRIDPGIVAAYHDVFFDVRAHLASTDYLLFKVVGDAIYRGVRERQYDLLWKLYALVGGPHVLDVALTTFVQPARPEDAASVGAFIQDAVKGKIGWKALVSGQVLEANSFTAPQIIDLYLKQCEVEKRGGGEGAHATILQNVGIMLKGLPFAVGRRGAAQAGPPALALLDASAIEPGGDEILRLGAGGAPEGDAAAAAFRFPDPPRRGGTNGDGHRPARVEDDDDGA